MSTYRGSLLWRAYDGLASLADRRRGWARLPRPIGLLVLIGARNVLRRSNLFDTDREPATNLPQLPPFQERWRTARSPDGAYNDIADARRGMSGTRFGRNVPPEATWPEAAPGILDPSPREVSRRLLTRDPFQPATAVNSLAAAWLQFMIRDWVKHGKSPKEDPWAVELEAGDPWPSDDGRLRIMRTPPDPTRPAGALGPPTYVNELTHWWDASSIYGRNQQEQQLVRGQGGRLAMGERRPPFFDHPLVREEPGFWLGLGLMHSLFAREHNAICEHLRERHPGWGDEELFDRARLVNAALLAKIHTVEWTPAVIGHPTTVSALRANWWGLMGEGLRRRFGRISRSEVLCGIPGSPTAHFGVPFALTEEFVAVYRMHPMIRDDWSLRHASDDGPIADLQFPELTGPSGLALLDANEPADLLYSLGTLNPGLVTLHNYPRTLQRFERPDGELMDLAAVDVMRTRELGLPRYNEFRRLMHLPRVERFEDLTGNPVWAEQIRQLYRDDIDRVDLLVGMYAEPLPPGFAFSDTALRVFILMATRRLNSDRFFTDDFRAEVYTPEGMDWIADNGLRSVLLRHHPELRAALGDGPNAFAPWARAGR